MREIENQRERESERGWREADKEVERYREREIQAK